MPNWTSNQLIIEGDAAQVKEAAEFIKSEGSAICFNKIIPMPQILKNTGSGTTTIEGQKVDMWFQDNSIADYAAKRKTERLFTPEEKSELANVGYKDWYDWSCAQWGTKWNACNAEVVNEDDGFIEIHFQTAWNAPEPIIAALRKKYPALDIQLNYRLEDDSEFPHSL